MTFALLALALSPGADPAVDEFFETKVRPVLVEHCVKCHGPTKQQGGVRLDGRDFMVKEIDGEPAVVKPGDAKTSRMMIAVRHEGEYPMPAKGKLAADQIAALTKWVEMGAPWPAAVVKATGPAKPHWAFQPITNPTPPAGPDAAPIDRFLAAKLKAAKLDFGPPADRRVWLRRVSIDLTGLPPTPAETEAFLKDPSPTADGTVVDRLLASPGFGERWGRHWLDVARYADTREAGFQVDVRYPFAWTYRDWVIGAFNRDVPFSEFAALQVAADHLRQDPEHPDLAALGFLTVGRRFSANGEQEDDVIDDRIDVLSRGFLGLSVGCARCHDHKFDPIPTKDYYSLYGVMRGLTAVERPFAGTDAERKNLADFRAEKVRLHQTWVDHSLAHHTTLFGDAFSADGYAASLLEWKSAKKFPVVLPKEFKANLSERRRAILTGYDKARWHPIVGPWLAFARLPSAGFAAAAPGVLCEIAESRQALAPRVAALFRDRPAPTSLHDVAGRYGELFAEIDGRWRAKFDGSRTHGTPVTTLGDRAGDEVWEFLVGKGGYAVIPVEEMKFVFGNDDGRKVWLEIETKIADLRASPTAPPHAFAVADPESPHNPRVFVRGNRGSPGPEVPRQFLAVATAGERTPFPDGTGRKNLAAAVADPTNPLTARVWVNRVWGHLFGAGLVATPSDFGTRGAPPTHPELLDHLAGSLMADGWSTKRLLRRLVLSRAYAQSSADRPEGQAADPTDALLWKMPRRRLDFEGYRDAALQAAGAIDARVGGRPVDLSADPTTPRRTVYAKVDRTALSTLHQAFDFANPDLHVAKRFITTVPQQAVLLLNHPFSADLARKLAAKSDAAVWHGAKDWPTAAYRSALGRDPTAAEKARALAFLAAAATPQVPEGRPVYWVYGRAKWDRVTKSLTGFEPLADFEADSWKLLKGSDGAITAGGGKTAADASVALVRRWIAPADGTVRIDGELVAKAGGRATVVGAGGVVAEWAGQSASVRTAVAKVAVKAGQQLDFFVEATPEKPAADFAWGFTIEPVATPSMGTMIWNSAGHFDGPPPKAQAALTAKQQFAQILLLSNEFATVD